MQELFDDFRARSGVWSYRTENFSSVELTDDGLNLCVGPTEALYYSDAEISDGGFGSLRWSGGEAEFRARLGFDHYGSAGFGFWNYSMVIGESMPIWFIYLSSRGRYPLKGFFVQAGKNFCPLLLRGPDRSFALISILSRIMPSLVGIRILRSRPVLKGLNPEAFHDFKVLWRGTTASFYVDGSEVCTIRDRLLEGRRARLDVWIDNAVFVPLRNDPGRVYRHNTQELQERHCLTLRHVRARA
ncbi:MAG: hypothetical protein ACP5GH_04605 [Nitrososphaeria archaeon]